MRIHELRPISVEIAAPQALVFEMAAATGGVLPGSPPHSSEVLERDGDTLLVRYRTPAVVTELVMIERVRLYPPDRIEYEVLEGPMEHMRETLAFEMVEPHLTVVCYSGIVGSDRAFVGGLIARWVAVPAYDRFMRRQLRALQIAAEARAVRSLGARGPEHGRLASRTRAHRRRGRAHPGHDQGASAPPRGGRGARAAGARRIPARDIDQLDGGRGRRPAEERGACSALRAHIVGRWCWAAEAGRGGLSLRGE